jgi:signal peptidase
MKITSLIKTTALTVICLLLVIPILIYGFPLLVGADSSYTVMSGSMSPALRPGDLVIVKGEEPVNVGDVVTIKSGEFTYTHRVVEKLEGDLFRLKGDANEDPDPGLVESSQIIGKVVLIFPFGYLYTSTGFALALLIPAALIVGKQAYNIHQSTKRRNRVETMRWRRKNHPVIDTTTLLLALILTVSTARVIAPHFISGSSSYFSSNALTTSTFGTGVWEVGANIVIEPDISPNTLNLGSDVQWVTVYIQSEYDAHKIDVNTVRLDGSIPAVTDTEYEFVTNPLVELNSDGNYAFMVKFERASVTAHMEGYVDGSSVTMTVSGMFLDGVRFSGTDTIVVIRSG